MDIVDTLAQVGMLALAVPIACLALIAMLISYVIAKATGTIEMLILVGGVLTVLFWTVVIILMDVNAEAIALAFPLSCLASAIIAGGISLFSSFNESG